MIPPPFDAWVLAKAISQQPITAADLAAMSEPWRELAERLAAAPAAHHGMILEAFLIGRSGKNEIIEALKNADPKAPAPMRGSIIRSAHLGDLTSCQRRWSIHLAELDCPSTLHAALIRSENRKDSLGVGSGPANLLRRLRGRTVNQRRFRWEPRLSGFVATAIKMS